jgi:hypothetical protein
MSKKTYNEPEEFQNDVEQIEATTDFNPFDEAVVEKEYRKANVDTSDYDFNSPIGEPSFTPPQLDPFGDSEIAPEIEQPSSFNPKLEELDNKEKKFASDGMADIILDGYEKLHDIGNKFVEISEFQFQKKVVEGEINPNLEIPFDAEGNTISPLEFIQEFNKQSSEAITLDPSFKTKVKPVLSRVLAKRGIGMTDEQQLAYYFLSDAVPKVAQLFALKKQTKMIFEMLQMQTQMMGAPAPNPNYTVPKQEQTESFSQDDLEKVRNEERDRLKAEMNEKRTPKARKPRTQNNMPTFGDPEILKKLDEIAEEEKKQRAEKTGTAKRGRKSKDQEQ